MTTVQCRWEIDVDAAHALGGRGTAHSFNAVDRSLFVHLANGTAGYLKLGADPVTLLSLDPKRNSDMSRAVFQELMILQKHGWPEDGVQNQFQSQTRREQFFRVKTDALLKTTWNKGFILRTLCE